MSGGSLGILSGSYGSLEKQLQNGLSPIQSARNPSKMQEKDKLFHWICNRHIKYHFSLKPFSKSENTILFYFLKKK